jgi:hypothetical protein
LLLQPGGPEHPWRALPVSFTHAPTPKIPKRAGPEEQAAIKEIRKKHRLSIVALEQLNYCRRQLDLQPGGALRWLIDVVDGGYSNRTFFRGLPERTDAVARMRKDARLRAYLAPAQRQGARKYGPDLPTPAAELIAAYLARWEVEVNFRDEKTLLGVGQAQVRNPQAVTRAPAFLVACYAMLLWSAIGVFGDRRTEAFESLPAWRSTEPARPSTRDLIRLLQRQAADCQLNQMRN